MACSRSLPRVQTSSMVGVYVCCHRVSQADEPLEQYLVQALMGYIEQLRGPPSRGSKVVTKPVHLTKMVRVELQGISRAAFIHVFLTAHGLGDDYAAGPHSGPNFKMWWTGIPYVQLLLYCNPYRR